MRSGDETAAHDSNADLIRRHELPPPRWHYPADRIGHRAEWPICRPYRTPARTRGTRSRRHVPLEPGHEPGQVISHGREPADAVSFPGVDHQFELDALLDQCLVKLPGRPGRRARSFPPAGGRGGRLALVACM